MIGSIDELRKHLGFLAFLFVLLYVIHGALKRSGLRTRGLAP